MRRLTKAQVKQARRLTKAQVKQARRLTKALEKYMQIADELDGLGKAVGR